MRTEKLGISILRDLEPRFRTVNAGERAALFTVLGISPKKYQRSIDGVILKVESINEVESHADLLLVEIKTTKSKKVTELPYGVFFGITENEEDLFKSLPNYRLCIVHTGLRKHVLLTFPEYQKMIHSKRVQFQVKFKSK
jgi:hypothetical protein